MKNLRQAFLGIMIALASLGLVLGAFSLSLAEGSLSSSLAPQQTQTPTSSPTLQPLTPSADSPTPAPTLTVTSSPSLTLTPSPTLTATWTPALSPTPTKCQPPQGWFPYTVQPGDTLTKIAEFYQIGVEELQNGNCMITELRPDMVIYAPLVSTRTPPAASTRTATLCRKQSSWIYHYTVQPGDTLYQLSLIYGVSVVDLQQANCIVDPNHLETGQVLLVPSVARTPLPTLPMLFTPTNTLEISSPTYTPVPPTDTLAPPTESPASPTLLPTPTDEPFIP